MTRENILEKAKEQITGKRITDYGKPEDNFGIIAKLWSDYIGIDISSLDVAMMMSLLKIARIKTGFGGTDDCFIDLAGYAACGGEIAGKRDDEYETKEKEIDEKDADYHSTDDDPDWLPKPNSKNERSGFNWEQYQKELNEKYGTKLYTATPMPNRISIEQWYPGINEDTKRKMMETLHKKG